MEKIQKKEITKKAYVKMVWTILISGLILSTIVSFYLISKVNSTLLGVYLMSGIIIGLAIGMSYAHQYKIKEKE